MTGRADPNGVWDPMPLRWGASHTSCNQPLMNGIAQQFNSAGKPELPHRVRLVNVDGFGAELETGGDPCCWTQRAVRSHEAGGRCRRADRDTRSATGRIETYLPKSRLRPMTIIPAVRRCRSTDSSKRREYVLRSIRLMRNQPTHETDQPALQRDPDQWKTGDEPMTAAQRSYLETLCRETGEEFDQTLTKADASKRIEELRERSPRLAPDGSGSGM